MAKRALFAIVFVPETFEHLAAIEPRHHRLIKTTIDEQLKHSPEVKTRNRKPLRLPAPFGATWELRFGPQNRFRVFYSPNGALHVVEILAIGMKEGNRLLVGKDEYEL